MNKMNKILLRLCVVLAIVPVLLVAGCGKSDSTDAASSAQNSAAVSSGEAGGETGEFACPTENTKTFAKTKFTLHAGLAFGAFKRWIYNPYRDGKFQKGADGRVMAFVKGAAAAAFTKREVRLAFESAQANPTLCKVIAKPLKDLYDKVGDTVTKTGGLNGGLINSLNGGIGSIMASSKKEGAEVTPDENANIGG